MNTLDFNETAHTFAACVLCGGTLDTQSEQFDGICCQCDPDAPMMLLPTGGGRATLHYLDAQRKFWSAVNETVDAEGIPTWEGPQVDAARDRMSKVSDFLRAIDYRLAPCDDCTNLICCCPDV